MWMVWTLTQMVPALRTPSTGNLGMERLEEVVLEQTIRHMLYYVKCRDTDIDGGTLMNDVFEKIVAIIEQDFYDETFLLEYWPAIKQRHQDNLVKAGSLEEQEQVLKSLLESLGVSHSVLIDPELARWIATRNNTATPSSFHINNYNNALFVSVRSFQVRRLRAVDVAALAQAMSDVSTIILDLRLNGGGSGSAVVELASLFLPPETPVLQIRTRQWQQQQEPFIIHTLPEEANIDHELEVELLRKHHWVEYRTKPSGTFIEPDKHVVVLIDKQCYSNGETFAGCMQEYTAATLIGKPTAGYVVAADEHDIGEGYMATVPFAMMLSGRGRKLEGVGVHPNIDIDLADLDEEQIIDRLYEIKVLYR